MARKRNPWVIRKQDFSKPGWHTRPTVGFELMFEFLRLSPSYELARKANEEGLTEDERRKLPADFDQVLATYNLLGNVQTVLFRAWWLKRGLHVFGNPYSKPQSHLIFRVPNGEEIGLADLNADLTNYLQETRRSEGLTAALLVAIPLGMRRSEVHKQIDLLMGQHTPEETDEEQKPKIALMGQRLRAKTLFNGIRLLWFRAAKPKWEYWRLGAKARLSKTYSPVLDPEATRKTANAIEQVDRDIMTKITHRALVKFEKIAENAARGRFPSDAPVEKADFDYAKLATIIKKKNAWEKRERERILAVHAAKKQS
jgi:hypothetical protein